ncbi:MAG: HEAT repeat domain-containing protein [Dehalococcoidia bacterium]|jgi:HEAT repeat protein
MDSKQQQVGEVIDKILNSDKEVLNSEIAVLSDLNDNDLAKFRTAWRNVDIQKRSSLISKMVGISEDHLILDFTRIYKLGLDDPDENIRIKSLEGLELEDKYIYARPIIKVLKSDESEVVRAVAARALSKFALMAELGDVPESLSRDIFSALLDTLENTKEPLVVRRRALEAVAPFRQELVEDYIEDYYHSEDAKVKASAIFAMGLNCSSRWLDVLIEEMQSKTPEFRYEAAKASGEIEDEQAVPYLLNLLNDDDREVQDAAIMSLGKIGGKEAKQALQRLSKSKDARIKDAANAALTELSACEDPLSLNF